MIVGIVGPCQPCQGCKSDLRRPAPRRYSKLHRAPSPLFAIACININAHVGAILGGNIAIDNAICGGQKSDGATICDHIAVYLNDSFSHPQIFSVLFSQFVFILWSVSCNKLAAKIGEREIDEESLNCIWCNNPWTFDFSESNHPIVVCPTGDQNIRPGQTACLTINRCVYLSAWTRRRKGRVDELKITEIEVIDHLKIISQGMSGADLVPDNFCIDDAIRISTCFRAGIILETLLIVETTRGHVLLPSDDILREFMPETDGPRYWTIVDRRGAFCRSRIVDISLGNFWCWMKSIAPCLKG